MADTRKQPDPKQPPHASGPAKSPARTPAGTPDKAPARTGDRAGGKTAEPEKTLSPDELIHRAAGERGQKAAETLHEAALLYRKAGDVVSAVHTLERGLAEIGDEIESPPVAKLGAAMQFDLGKLCEEDLGRYEEALIHYQNAFKLRPDSLEPLRRGRVIYQSLGDMDMVARLIDLHLANLNASDLKTGVSLSLELGQLKLRLNDPAGAVEALRAALRMHNEVAPKPGSHKDEGEEIPEPLLSTLADAYVSPEYLPGVAEKESARKNAGEIYLSLAKRHVDPELVKELEKRQKSEDAGEPLPPLLISSPDGERELKDPEKRAIAYLKKALDADARNVAAAGLLELLYLRLPVTQRQTELAKLYRGGARVARRGPKLLKLFEEMGKVDFTAVIDACRAGLEAVNSVDEWKETRAVLIDTLQKAGDQLGLASLKEDEAAEAALPEERAELLMGAAELYQKGGDQERYIACLKQAFQELPLHTEAFRKLSDYFKSRRDFMGLTVLQEERMAAQFQTARLDLQSYTKQLEELAELYEKKLQDVISAGDIWQRIDELMPSAKSKNERRRLAARRERISLQINELNIDLERLGDDDGEQRVELLRRMGQLYREAHASKHAEAAYSDLLSLSPNDLPSIKILIELREQSGDVAGQLDLLRQQVGMVTDRAERLSLLRRMMALCDQRMLQRDGQWGEEGVQMTIWVCRSLLAELPADRDALRRLADALQLLGNKTELLDVLEAYLKVAPTPREKLSLHKQIAKVAEDTEDLARSVSHLERAVRISPPGPESEEVLSELARVYGKQGRTELAVQTLELCLKQNPRASVELHRLLGRLTQAGTGDEALIEKSVRAYREVLARLPDDVEALLALQQLHRQRSEWHELEHVLRRLLRAPEPPLPPRDRVTIALELAETLAQRMGDPKQAAALLEQVQAESPVVDLRVHRHLRGLYEEMGEHLSAVRYAERELLLTEDPVARLERAMEIAVMWQGRARDRGRALLSYERVVRMTPELSLPGPVELEAARKLMLQALEAMGQMFVESGEWGEVVLIGQRRLAVFIDQGEPMKAAAILVELAQVYEEKLSQPADGFALRRQAFELAPEMVPLEQMAQVAEKYGLWQELGALHTARITEAEQIGVAPPLDSLIAAAQIHEQRLREPNVAFKLLRRALPQTGETALQATTPGTAPAQLLSEMQRLVRASARHIGRGDVSEAAIDAVTLARELCGVYRGLGDELLRTQSMSEDVALRLHRLLGASARLRDDLLGDEPGALGDRMHAFTVGGERDHSDNPEADAVFAETVKEIHRLAASAGQIKEAMAVDTRRMERAESDERRQQVACESAAWLDEHGGDAQRALKSCIKALQLCADGSDAQAEMRGRLFKLGQRLGLLAWDEIARAERALATATGDPAVLRQRLLYLSAMWQHGAVDTVRAIDAAGQAYRLTFFRSPPPAASPGGAKGGPALSELVIPHPDGALIAEQQAARATLDRIVQAAASDGEGAGKLIGLLDSLTNQLNEAGAQHLATQVMLDAGQVDERRGRNAQAERRYQEAAKQPATTEAALASLERLYRSQRRLADLAALLERRRALLPESAQRPLLLELADVYREINKHGPALTSLQQALAIEDSDAEPYLLMARLYEAQRTLIKAVDSYHKAALRARRPAQAARALLLAAELLERKLDEPDEALEAFRGALRRTFQAIVDAQAAGEVPDTQLLTDRDTAWNGAERLLKARKRDAELAALLEERLAATAEDATDERAELLSQRLAILRQLRTEAGAQSPEARATQTAPLVKTLDALLHLRPDDDALLDQKEALLAELDSQEEARDVAVRRAEAAVRRGALPEEQTERWLAVSRRELALDNHAGAETALEQALLLRPDSVAALQTLVELHGRTKNYPAQVAVLDRLAAQQTELEPAVSTLLKAADVTRRALHDESGARRLLLEALGRLESSKVADAIQAKVRAQVLAPLFELARQDGDIDGAADYARQAIATGTVESEPAAALHAFLGKYSLDDDQPEAARRHFEASLKARPGQLEPTQALLAILQPAGEFARMEPLIGQALAAADAGDFALAPTERASLLRQQAEARQVLGQAQGAYESLLAAEDLAPGNTAQQVWLGDSAFALGRHTVAARFLGGLLPYAEQPDALPEPLTVAKLGDSLDRAAQAHMAQGQPSEARILWQAVLKLAPDHAGASEHYLDLLLQSGDAADAEQALELLGTRAERATAAGDVKTAAREYERAAQLCVDKLDDAARAHALLQKALEQIAASQDEAAVAASRQLRARLYESAQRLGDLAQAMEQAAQLAQEATEPADKSRWLRQAADCALAQEQRAEAKTLLQQALSATPRDVGLLVQFAMLLEDDEAATVLGGLLEQATPKAGDDGKPLSATDRQGLIALWVQFAQAQQQLDENEVATRAYDQALALAASPDVEPRIEYSLRRAALTALPEGDHARARAHLGVLLASSALDVDLLHRLREVEEAAGQAGAAWRVSQVLHVLDPNEPLPPPATPVPTGVKVDEAEHARWALPEARALADVLSTLFDGVYGPKAPTLDTFGVATTDRLLPSESSADELARTFAMCCRVLGNQRSGLYRPAGQQHVLPKVLARMPTALIASVSLSKRPAGEMQFVLARAVEGLRPEYILGLAMPPADLANLIGLSVRAFHPRHLKQAAEDVAAWKRELAYRAVKRLSDWFRDNPDVEFSTTAWRRAVRRTIQRAALLVAGDLIAAANVLRTLDLDYAEQEPSGFYLGLGDNEIEDPAAEAEADLRDLCAFFIDPAFAALLDRLHPR